MAAEADDCQKGQLEQPASAYPTFSSVDLAAVGMNLCCFTLRIYRTTVHARSDATLSFGSARYADGLSSNVWELDMKEASARQGRRTPQACNACRRRKTKCNGKRPRCQYCNRRNIVCQWPLVGVENGESVSEPTMAANQATPAASSVHSPVVPSSSRDIQVTIPNLACLRRTFDLFFERHSAVDFCSFESRHALETEHSEKPFLVTTIIALCSRYLTPTEAKRDYGLESGRDVWYYYSAMAKSLAKEESNCPTVPNIQAYLVLALSEVISNSACSHWLYSGTAIRMAQMMRLNKEYQQKHSLREQETRRRTFWACFLMDRLLAFLMNKPRTLSENNIGVALPSTDVSVAYGEPTRGITLASLLSNQYTPSNVGLAPYLLKTVSLWSDMADMNVSHRRFIDKLPPTDPQSLFFQRSKAITDWHGSIPLALEWSAANYAAHCELGQGWLFVTTHLLLRSALCVTHQCYLPQMDGVSLLMDQVDAAGWPLLHREQSLISTSLYNALEIGEIIRAVMERGSPNDLTIELVWIACSLLPAANIFLWLCYARKDGFADEATCNRARTYFDSIQSLLASWSTRWDIAHEWQTGLRIMEVTYRAAYLGEVPPDAEIEELSPSTHREELASEYKPSPGDGGPLVSGVANLYDSLRMITTEAASVEDMRAVWLYLAGGWSQEFGDFLFPSIGDGL